MLVENLPERNFGEPNCYETGGDFVNAKAKKYLIAGVCVAAVLAALHVAVNVVFPMVKAMHSGMF